MGLAIAYTDVSDIDIATRTSPALNRSSTNGEHGNTIEICDRIMFVFQDYHTHTHTSRVCQIIQHGTYLCGIGLLRGLV